MSENRFCGACGAPAAPGEVFCTACGRSLPASVASAPAQPAASGERVIAVIGNLTQVGGFMGMKQKTFTLMITDRRLVFAELTKEKITAMVNQARDSAKAQGKGFFGQWGAQLGSSMNYHEAYWQMSPDAALAENPGNFAIERGAFQSAKFKIGITDDEHNTPDELVIKAASGKYKFNVNGSLGAVKDVFRQAGLA